MLNLTAHIRRLNASGHPLYVRLSPAELIEQGLEHGDTVRLDIPGCPVEGVIKTSGDSPWLGPLPGAKGQVPAALAAANLKHEQNFVVAVTVISRTPRGRPRDLPPVILVENERTAGGDYDHWQDATGERYQFPNSYKTKILTDRRFVYYRGARRADGTRGDPEYFGHGTIGPVRLDPETDEAGPKARWKWVCDIDTYEPFEKPVSFREGDGYIEEIPQNLWGVVRELPEDRYERILVLAKAPRLRPIDSPSAKTLEPREADAADLLPIVKSKRTATGVNVTRGQRRSRESKAVGDQGEAVVLEHLHRILPDEVAATLIHEAAEGRTPGYDISYRVDGQVIGVEVKATRGSAFPSIEITSNEWSTAQALGPRYRLALVSEAMTNAPRIALLDDVVRRIKTGEFDITPSVYRIARAETTAETGA